MSDLCIPLDIELLGFTRADITPPPVDTDTRDGCLLARVLITPQQSTCVVRLRGGREIRVTGWAGRTSLSYSCPHEQALRERETGEQRLREAVSRLIRAAGALLRVQGEGSDTERYGAAVEQVAEALEMGRKVLEESK